MNQWEAESKRQAAAHAAMTAFRPVKVMYTNHRGERRRRHVQPVRFYYGATPWHPTPGTLLDCIDLETGQERTFALSGISEWEEENE